MSESQVDGVLRPETPPRTKEDQKVLAESLLTPSRQPVDEPSTDVVNWLHLLYLGFVANIGTFLFGFDFGSVSWFLSAVNKYADSDDNSVAYNYYRVIESNNGLYGLVAAGSAIGATFTYIFLLFYGNNMPKKDEIQIAAILYFVGGLFESESGSLSWHYDSGLTLFVFGRLIYGAGIALSFHAVLPYVSEYSPPKYRGILGSTTEVMVVTGVFLSYTAGYLTHNESNGWQVPFRASYIVAVFMGSLSLFLPQSITWMIRNNIPADEMLRELQFVYPNATPADVAKVEQQHEAEMRTREKWNNVWKNDATEDFFHRTFLLLPPEIKLLLSDNNLLRCLMLTITLVIIQNLAGQSAILYFAGDIFDELCPNTPYSCIFGLGLVKILPAYAIFFIADSLGRRVYLIAGGSIMLLGLFLVCVSLGSDSGVALFGIYASVVGYEVSFGIMLWILISEIFPSFVRSSANSISIAVMFLLSTIVTYSLPYLEDSIGLIGIFSVFTAVSAISLLIFYLFVPETRGVDIEVCYKLVSQKYVETLKAVCDVDNIEDEIDIVQNTGATENSNLLVL